MKMPAMKAPMGTAKMPMAKAPPAPVRAAMPAAPVKNAPMTDATDVNMAGGMKSTMPVKSAPASAKTMKPLMPGGRVY